MTHAYRDSDEHIVTRRLRELDVARKRLAAHMPALNDARSARLARLSAGVVGVAGAVATVLACIDTVVPEGPLATYCLVGSVGASVATYVVVRVLTVLLGRVDVPPQETFVRGASLAEDLQRLDELHPLRVAQAKLERREVASVAWPLAAISLLAPLTLHFGVAMAFMDVTLRDFSKWIMVSAIVVGLAHLALVAMAVRYAVRIGKMSVEAFRAASPNRDWVVAYCVAILASCVPGILLMAVPPAISLVTGLAFIPFMFRWARSCILRERDAIVEAQNATDEVRIRVDLTNFGDALQPVLASDPFESPAAAFTAPESDARAHSGTL